MGTTEISSSKEVMKIDYWEQFQFLRQSRRNCNCPIGTRTVCVGLNLVPHFSVLSISTLRRLHSFYLFCFCKPPIVGLGSSEKSNGIRLLRRSFPLRCHLHPLRLARVRLPLPFSFCLFFFLVGKDSIFLVLVRCSWCPDSCLWFLFLFLFWRPKICDSGALSVVSLLFVQMQFLTG